MLEPPGIAAKLRERPGVHILIAAGSSGGHIMPALAFAQECERSLSSARIKFVLPRCRVTSCIDFGGFSVTPIAITALTPSISGRFIAALFNFLKGSLQSLLVIIRDKPDIVVGFGGIATVPLVMSAWLARIPTIIHEQNVLPGAANNLLALFADRIAIAFEQAFPYFKFCAGKTYFTGMPICSDRVRRERKLALNFFDFSADIPTLLIVGGSQGSRSLNRAVLRIIRESRQMAALQVIHVTGSADFEFVRGSYAQLGVKSRVYSFCSSLPYAYSAADIVVSRAGAMSVAEVAFFGIPAIFVPYPFARRHQEHNSAVLSCLGCARVIADDNRLAEVLKGQLENWLANPAGLTAIKAKLGEAGFKNGAPELVGLAVSLINE